MAERDYTNGEITVHWDSVRCIHCEACFIGLPKVFDPKERPWVRMNVATTAEIVDQVEKCPSGALSII
jgi:uncharacterized Fe-S cluster protein YjdI